MGVAHEYGYEVSVCGQGDAEYHDPFVLHDVGVSILCPDYLL